MNRRRSIGTLAATLFSPALPLQLGEGPGGRRMRDVIRSIGEAMVSKVSAAHLPEFEIEVEITHQGSATRCRALPDGEWGPWL